MAEYIKREAALMKLMQDGCSAKNLQSISDMPAADVAPVRHARWKRYGKNLGECSECGEIVSVRNYYCPNCGAKMDEKEDKHENYT